MKHQRGAGLELRSPAEGAQQGPGAAAKPAQGCADPQMQQVGLVGALRIPLPRTAT